MIRVKKTNVESGNSATPPALSPANWCVVHQKPHPLSRCRAFQAKSLDERTKILKQNCVCFRIASCDHLARNCKAKITCTECGSTQHLLRARATRMCQAKKLVINQTRSQKISHQNAPKYVGLPSEESLLQRSVSLMYM